MAEQYEADDLERILLAGILNDPEKIDDLELDPSHFLNPRHGIIYKVIRELRTYGSECLLSDIVAELDSGDHDLINGTKVSFQKLVNELVDIDPQLLPPDVFARKIKLNTLTHRQTLLHQEAVRSGTDRNALDQIRDIEEEKERVAFGVGIDVDKYVFRGARLNATRDREERLSPLPGYLDPLPSLGVVVGKPKTGKTTFVLALSEAWSLGMEPWQGAPKLPGSQVLVISAEQPLTRVDSTLRRMDTLHLHADRDRWTDRVSIVARDLETHPAARPLFCLDDDGIELLSHLLTEEAKSGNPYGLLVLDSASRLKPHDVEEDSNDGMTRWLDSLQKLAEIHEVWILLIHHVGFSGRDEARTAGRGASSIGAVAQTIWLLEDVKENPRQRRLKIQGNSVPASEQLFEVSPEDAEPGTILYWKPTSELGGYAPQDYLQGAEQISTSELSWRIFEAGGGNRGEVDRPPSSASRLAAKLRERWGKDSLVVVTDGPRNSKLMALPHEEEV